MDSFGQRSDTGSEPAPGRAGDVSTHLWRQAFERFHRDPVFSARAKLAASLLQATRSHFDARDTVIAREAAAIALVLADVDVEALMRPDPAAERLAAAVGEMTRLSSTPATPLAAAAELRRLLGLPAEEGTT